MRVDRASELRADQADRKIVKSARGLLLRNRYTLGSANEIKLTQFLAANERSFVVNVLRDALRGLWHHRESWQALHA